MAITASDARKRLFPIIQQVNDDRVPVEVITRGGDRAYIVAADDFEAMAETDYLLQSPANADRLLDAVENVRNRHRLYRPSPGEMHALLDDASAAA
jgi:antitoxin YefM